MNFPLEEILLHYNEFSYSIRDFIKESKTSTMKEQNRHYYHDIGSGPHAGPLLNIPNQPRYQGMSP